jgi:hypothetical protein
MSITMQEYFDKTVRHLVDQGKRAWGPSPTRPGREQCLYLAPDGTKCAVGAHIPDGHDAQRSPRGIYDLAIAHPDLEGVAWPEDTEEHDGLQLASRLQSVHDDENSWRPEGGLDVIAWRLLRDVASEVELSTAVLDELRP